MTPPVSTIASDGLRPLFNTRACQDCDVKDGCSHCPPPGLTTMRAAWWSGWAFQRMPGRRISRRCAIISRPRAIRSMGTSPRTRRWRASPRRPRAGSLARCRQLRSAERRKGHPALPRLVPAGSGLRLDGPRHPLQRGRCAQMIELARSRPFPPAISSPFPTQETPMATGSAAAPTSFGRPNTISRCWTVLARAPARRRCASRPPTPLTTVPASHCHCTRSLGATARRARLLFGPRPMVSAPNRTGWSWRATAWT